MKTTTCLMYWTALAVLNISAVFVSVALNLSTLGAGLCGIAGGFSIAAVIDILDTLNQRKQLK